MTGSLRADVPEKESSALSQSVIRKIRSVFFLAFSINAAPSQMHRNWPYPGHCNTISVRDTSVRKGRKENFYHGTEYHCILLGLLAHREDWYIRSNAESGDGFSDILIEIEEEGIGIVIEVKYPNSSRKTEKAAEPSTRDANLEKGCREALAQIEDLGYEAALRMDGMDTVIKYGIACERKRCRVMVVV